jgi:hypothetical protein
VQGPGDTDESRLFLQRRIALFLAVSAGFWALLALIVVLLAYVIPPLSPLMDMASYRPVVKWFVGLVVALGAGWIVFRRGARSLRSLNAVEAAAPVVQVLTILALLSADPRARYGGVDPMGGFQALILAVTHIVFARAAMVPSNPRRTAAISGACTLMFALGTYVIFARAHIPGWPPAMFVFTASVWGGLTLVLAAVISRVIYRLELQVRQNARLGQYTLGQRIGGGGMGEVYHAHHALLRRPTAIKVLPPERAGEAAIARFEREVQITSRLTHPNTIAIYDYGRTPQHLFYYAMEYLDGIDLESLVRADGPQPAGRVLGILRQIVGALAEAHDASLIHRDIKPANVILCEYSWRADMAKVLDFGLVKEIGTRDAAVTGTEAIMGTPLYLSPEAILTPDKADARSDLYSVGALGYFLLTGQTVFTGDSVLEICGHHLHSTPVPPSERSDREVPASLERLILACLEKQRDQRPASAGALLALLNGCDDVTGWTDADARLWWRKQKTGVNVKVNGDGARDAAARHSAAHATRSLTVDFFGRERVPTWAAAELAPKRATRGRPG